MATDKFLHAEVQRRPGCTLGLDVLAEEALEYLTSLTGHVKAPCVLKQFDGCPSIQGNVASISLEAGHGQYVSGCWSEFKIYVYAFEFNDSEVQYMGGGAGDSEYGAPGESSDTVPQSQQRLLPCAELENSWATLLFDTHVRQELLNYASTAMLFADRQVDPSIISCNRVVLLHGPPGTGKTSLCHALAQKLSIRLSHRYRAGTLVEINSHSLFSKWFSESGKLVQRMFKTILELVEEEDMLVCLLIDEVESLAANRQACSSGADPGDALRVVNALLTQIDRLRQHPNVLILATSNITGAIDLAFVDRADMKIYIGLPSMEARYAMFKMCIMELVRVGLVKAPYGWQDRHSSSLVEIAKEAQGFSGRTIKKLPMLAHALFVQATEADLHTYLDALRRATLRQKQERAHLHPDAAEHGADGDT